MLDANELHCTDYIPSLAFPNLRRGLFFATCPRCACQETREAVSQGHALRHLLVHSCLTLLHFLQRFGVKSVHHLCERES